MKYTVRFVLWSSDDDRGADAFRPLQAIGTVVVAHRRRPWNPQKRDPAAAPTPIGASRATSSAKPSAAEAAHQVRKPSTILDTIACLWRSTPHGTPADPQTTTKESARKPQSVRQRSRIQFKFPCSPMVFSSMRLGLREQWRRLKRACNCRISPARCTLQVVQFMANMASTIPAGTRIIIAPIFRSPQIRRSHSTRVGGRAAVALPFPLR